MITTQDILQRIEDELATTNYPSEPEGLYEPIEYVLEEGGKRLRPTLLLLAYSIYREDLNRAMPAAIGLETYHNHTLLHDDLMDKADMRRGRPTVHKKWDDNTAILSGDTMLVLAYEHLAKCDTKYLKPALDLFTETALEVSEGQQFDMEFETRNDVAEEEYIEMIRLKTSVLLACALKMGAVVAGASDADAETRAELERWTTATEFDPAEKIAAVTEIYNRLGIDKLAEQRIKEYFEQSRQHLDELSVSDDRKAVLREYTERMMNRKK